MVHYQNLFYQPSKVFQFIGCSIYSFSMGV